MPGFKLKTIVVTCTTAGTAYPASGILPAGTMIQPTDGNSGKVYVGAAGVAAATGYLITATAPVRLGDLLLRGCNEDFYGPSIYFVSASNGDKVTLLVPERDQTAV